MMLSKHCQECTHANTIGDCEGKTNEELQRIPCSKWEFDMALLDEPNELVDEQEQPEKGEPIIGEGQIIGRRPIIDNNVPPVNETPANKFKRISANRLKRTLYELKLLAQFGRLYRQYEWTQAQADEIVAALQKGVDIVKHKLTDKAIK